MAIILCASLEMLLQIAVFHNLSRKLWKIACVDTHMGVVQKPQHSRNVDTTKK